MTSYGCDTIVVVYAGSTIDGRLYVVEQMAYLPTAVAAAAIEAGLARPALTTNNSDTGAEP
jgi:hypothetical protein